MTSQPIPAAINRGAYYLSNFEMQIDQVRETGKLQTMFPTDFPLPMVAPEDLGKVAVGRLTSGLDDVCIVSIEGPTRPTLGDVADAFADALGSEVLVVTTPRDKWVEAFKSEGFSEPAADAYARMTAAAIDGPATPESETEKGRTSLKAAGATETDLIARLLSSCAPGIEPLSRSKIAQRTVGSTATSKGGVIMFALT